MKSSTNHKMKLPRKIIQTIQSDPGAMARIARRVRRRDGRKGVSLSMVSHVLALRKRSRAIEAEIAREAGRINRERYLRAAGRIADLAQRYELAEVAQ